MASSLPSLCTVVMRLMPSMKRGARPSLQVRAQSCRDEGRSSNFTDVNLMILRERIEEVRIRERIEICCRIGNGWNYAPGYEHKGKRSEGLPQFLELFGLVTGTFGLTLVSGTLCLSLVSLLVHFNQ